MKKFPHYIGMFALSGACAQGALVSVDIQFDDSAPAVESTTLTNAFGVFADDDADYIWNEVSQATAGAGTGGLVDTDGDATGITIDINGASGRANDWGVDPILQGGNWDNTGNLTLTIGGLSASTAYQIVLFSADPHAIEATPTANGIAAIAYGGSVVSSGVNDFYEDAATVGGRDTFWYFDVDSDSSGEILLAQGGSPASFNTIVGFQIIPEPSSALLGGLGFLALLRRRR